MKINKKLAVTLAIIFLFNTSGLFAHFHYCKDTLKHFSFYCDTGNKEQDICDCINYETENFSFSNLYYPFSETIISFESTCCVDNYILILNKIESDINCKTKSHFIDLNIIFSSNVILFRDINEKNTLSPFILSINANSSTPTFLKIKVLLI